MFCICSNKSIDEIVAAQEDIPLPFAEMLECLTGCGSCIPVILERVEHSNMSMHDNG